MENSRFEQTGFKDLIIFRPQVFGDERGSFRETYNKKLWESVGIFTEFLQDNLSISSAGILRGLHFQEGKAAQTKLVRVNRGRAFVAVVDLREQENTFKQVFTITLDSQSETQLHVPRGFAHGFLALEDGTEYLYKVDNYRVADMERGLDAFDESLAIEWPIPKEEITRKGADEIWPKLI